MLLTIALERLVKIGIAIVIAIGFDILFIVFNNYTFSYCFKHAKGIGAIF